MMHELLLIFALSTIPAASGLFLDYALGFPGKDEGPNTKAILFKAWSFNLAKKALIKNRRYQEIINRFEITPGSDIEAIQKAIDLTIFIEGKKYFFYEQAFGMCIYCTNFWISTVAATVLFCTVPLQFFNHFFFFLFIPIFSHSIIRKF